MLRQLARLTRPVEAAGDRALAIAVYADATGRAFPAAAVGTEGVACVDDAARALVLFCDLWEATRLSLLRAWAEGLLEFVLFMQDADGRFVNFIADWSGRRNERGPTSLAGGGFWHARGLRALATADLVLGDTRARECLARGLEHTRSSNVPADVRAIHVLTALELLRAGRTPDLRHDLEAWCDEIASCRSGDVLMDNPDETAPHLWGHLQEGVLAEAGGYLGRADLVAVARSSALGYLAPLIESGFEEDTAQPYGIACAVYGVERLAAVTGERAFDALAVKARAWFDHRNPAGRPVYDRRVGRVHDGIDRGALNEHSGAESNIVGAQALFAQVERSLPALVPAIVASLPAATQTRLPMRPDPANAGVA